MTLAAMDLSDLRLGLSLLGFNLGIEIMQLIVLPPLVALSRTRIYTPLRTVAAAVTAIAATGWLLDRVGLANPIGAVADALGGVSPWIVPGVWVAAAAVLVRRRVCAGRADRPADRDTVRS